MPNKHFGRCRSRRKWLSVMLRPQELQGRDSPVVFRREPFPDGNRHERLIRIMDVQDVGVRVHTWGLAESSKSE
jgi:hypothetical protein